MAAGLTLILAACANGSPPSPASRDGAAAGKRPGSSAEAGSPATSPTDSAGASRIPSALRRGAVRPASASQAAAQLAVAERLISSPRGEPAVLRLAGQIQQLAYRELGARPAWDDRVLASLPRWLRPVVRANVAARREFRSMHTTLSDTLPAWRIVRPAPAADLLRYYRRAEAAYGVGWEYLAAINLVETGMGRIRGVSSAGAQGPMQFLPSTWAAYGKGDINDPADAIMAAARYLAANGFTRPGGVAGAVYRYNNSTAYVRGVTRLAQVMERRPSAFYGYYHWRIYYLTTEGDVLLPHGYHAERPIPVERYLARNPQQ